MVSTQSSIEAPFKNMVPRILDVSEAKILAFTPLPIPSARINIFESSVLSNSTLSPQSSSSCLFRLLKAASIHTSMFISFLSQSRETLTILYLLIINIHIGSFLWYPQWCTCRTELYYCLIN